MTIKNKLLLSNILIIALPTLAVLACGLIMFFLLFGIQDDQGFFSKKDNIKYTTEKEAKAAIENEEYQQVCDDVTVYRDTDNNYIMVYKDEANMPSHHVFSYFERHTFLLFIILTTLLIFFINRLLAHQILKSIVKPLDILTNGANELSNGNLDYRIQYDKKDEFSSACDAFNEMATRLSDMTLLQQKEEQNRKELIAGISHDLRTPLTAIKAYVVGLETGVAKTPQMQKKYLSTINQKTVVLEYIINQLFLFSKLDLGDFPFYMEAVDICEELTQLVLNMKEEYKKKGVLLSCNNLPQTAVCNIDTIQFDNIIQNLWENTAKYKQKETAVSTITALIQDDLLHIYIADDGPGVLPESLDKLFDVFYRTDTARQNVSMGSGLGLAISAKVINSFHGSICAKNIPDGGLCIEITLPLAGKEEEK